MSLWEFSACVGGYTRAHSTEEEKLPAPTPEKFLAMVEARAKWMH